MARRKLLVAHKKMFLLLCMLDARSHQVSVNLIHKGSSPSPEIGFNLLQGPAFGLWHTAACKDEVHHADEGKEQERHLKAKGLLKGRTGMLLAGAETAVKEALAKSCSGDKGKEVVGRALSVSPLPESLYGGKEDLAGKVAGAVGLLSTATNLWASLSCFPWK